MNNTSIKGVKQNFKFMRFSVAYHLTLLLSFKPTYNPYTEPSLEVYSYHVGLKKWVEIGNSGV